ncbi:hypothetical protein BLS_000217 [Venturia inaequalis]|uniref:ferric-chelate reductase (NADPH) n=1 Tax=Venturia inaequalis TaxID=5025 RepID=A0A8H3YPN2_VENIN|nr:hypothetical protein BLS_000217 [Venturia inaequalis]KAE9968740.1 hypothetical protein EG327_010946 [Venturia inaequalis]RDI82254.1 hypothetical protein Vi05172_g7896 [Venturia inaequalis]
MATRHLLRLAVIAFAASVVTANAPAAPAGAATAAAKKKKKSEDEIDWELVRGLLWSWLVMIGCLFAYTTSLYFVRYVRTVSCLNNDSQRFFARPTYWFGNMKRHLLDAPLFRARHHREFKLSSALNMGTLPSRLQTIALLAYVVVSVTITCWAIAWDKPKAKILSQLTQRTGYLAIVNMVPLFILAGRNNPLIQLTGITFDTYNLIHRWLGRIVITEAVIHGTCWVVNKVNKSGWKAVGITEQKSMFILSGTIAASAFVGILFQSPSVVRHAFYETFLHTHQALAALALGAVWVHLAEFPTEKMIIKGVLAIWVIERCLRIVRICYRNVGNGGTRADVEVLPGDAVRVTMKLARPWRFAPGQHAYIYMPSIGFWMSHPFSVAWSDEAGSKQTIVDEKGLDMGSVESQDVLTVKETTISFIIRARTGFTAKLFQKADRSPNGRFSTTAYAEGPYGSQQLHSFGTVLLFAAGVGITHQVPHVRELVTGYGNGTVAARKVVLVWIIQSPEHLEWIRPWMTEILGLPRRREVLKILLFVTRPKSTKEIHSPSSSVQMFPGKPNIQALIDQEVDQSIGAVGVTVCGIGGLADEVRKGCRNWMGSVNIEFVEESFSW